IHEQGSRPDIRVPFREIMQDPTPDGFGGEPNPPVTVYDTSGPYTDPDVDIDIRRGLPGVRSTWIAERNDTCLYEEPASAYGRRRLEDPALAGMRFPHKPALRRATSGTNVTQMHYARRGIITPEMEYVAIRENLRRDAYEDALRQSGP